MEFYIDNQRFVYNDKCECIQQKKNKCKKKKVEFCKVCNAYVADVLFSGMGSAGTTAARYVSDIFSTLIIEAGIDHRGDPLVEGGVSALVSIAGSELTASSKYSISKLVPIQQLASESGSTFLTEKYSSGKGAGGSSSHDYMLAVRGTADIYDQWAQISGNPQWTYNNLLPIMKGLENFVFINGSPGITQNPTERHQGGVIQNMQLPFDPADPRIQAFAAGLRTPFLPDYNVRSGEIATSFSQLFVYPTLPILPRSYAMDFLPLSILDSQGNGVGGRPLKVLFEHTVLKVIFNKCKDAIGLAFLTPNKKIKVAFARHMVVLSSGACLSSGILQHSGIGPANVLANAKIPLLIDNPNVGANLQNHIGPTVNFTLSAPLPALQILSFISGQPYFNSTQRELEIIISNGTVLSNGTAATDVVRAQNITSYGTATMWLLRPESRGTAFIVDGNFYDLPDIRYNSYSAPRDRQIIIAGLRVIRDAVHAIGETMIYPPESHFIGPNSDNALFQDVLALLPHGQATNHYTGTTAMGTVVDGNLKVIGVNKLMIADLGIAPKITTGNTRWPALYIGAMAAKILGAPVPTA